MTDCVPENHLPLKKQQLPILSTHKYMNTLSLNMQNEIHPKMYLYRRIVAAKLYIDEIMRKKLI